MITFSRMDSHGNEVETKQFETLEQFIEHFGGAKQPDPCCYYCTEYDGSRCMKHWNNADPRYYISWRDDKDECDVCESYNWNGGMEA